MLKSDKIGNGRVYDPIVGRFLNVDPYVQFPMQSNSFNRYSYCLNNPLKYTDPSGYEVDWGGGRRYARAHKYIKRHPQERDYSYEEGMSPEFASLILSLSAFWGGDGNDNDINGGGIPSPSGIGGPGGSGGNGIGDDGGNDTKYHRINGRRLVKRPKTNDVAYYRNSGGIVKESYLQKLAVKAEKDEAAARLLDKINKNLEIEMSVAQDNDDDRRYRIPLYGKDMQFSPLDDVWSGMRFSGSHNGKSLFAVNGRMPLPSFTRDARFFDLFDFNLSRLQPNFDNIYRSSSPVLNWGGSTTIFTFTVVPTVRFRLQTTLEY